MDIDQDNNIWLGTFNGGLNKFNPTTGSFTRFEHHTNDASTICSNKIKKLLVDQEGNVWIGSIDNGTTVLNKNDKVIKHFKTFHSPNQVKETVNSIFCIYQYKNKRIWVGLGDHALFYLDNNTGSFIPFLNPVDKNTISLVMALPQCLKILLGKLGLVLNAMDFFILMKPKTVLGITSITTLLLKV